MVTVSVLKGHDVGLKDKWPQLRRPLAVALVASTVLLAGCSSASHKYGIVGLPQAATDRAPVAGNLWLGFWIIGAMVGLLVWGLIIFSIIRFRKRNDEAPQQTRYNLPMEVFYTAVPLLIVGVLFYFTVIAQNKVRAESAHPDVTVNVVGQKWSWTFNYQSAGNPAVGKDVYDVGTIYSSPDLVLPVNKSVHFNLSSPDVIHSFWVPSFYMKLDVIPGRHNSFEATPTRLGTYRGHCAELCGTYHSAMIFSLKVVSQQEYDNYLKSLANKGQIGEATGPKMANAPAGPKEGKR